MIEFNKFMAAAQYRSTPDEDKAQFLEDYTSQQVLEIASVLNTPTKTPTFAPTDTPTKAPTGSPTPPPTFAPTRASAAANAATYRDYTNQNDSAGRAGSSLSSMRKRSWKCLASLTTQQ